MGLLDYNIEPEPKRKGSLPSSFTPIPTTSVSAINPNQKLIDEGKAIAIERAGGSEALLYDLTDDDYIEMGRESLKEKEHGIAGELAAGLGRGALRVAATPAYLADIAGEAVGWKGLERAGEAGAEAVEQYIKESPRLQKSTSVSGDIRDNPQLWTDPRWYASIVGEGAPTIASMFIPGMAAARAARVAGMGAKAVQAARMGGVLAAGVGLEAGGAAEDIRQYEKRTGKQIPISTKLKTVTGTGVIAGSLEAIPVFNIFGKAVAKKLIGRIITSMALEGGTEGAQEIVANAFAKVGYDADRDMVGGVIESVVGGVLLGGGMGAMQQTFQERIQKTDPKEVANLLEQAEKEITVIPEEINQVKADIKSGLIPEGIKSGDLTLEDMTPAIERVTTQDPALAKQITDMFAVKETDLAENERRFKEDPLDAENNAEYLDKYIKRAALPEAEPIIPEPEVKPTPIEPTAEVAREPVGVETIAKETGATYKGEAEGLHYWDVDVGRETPTTIATEKIDIKELQKKIADTKETFAVEKPVKEVAPEEKESWEMTKAEYLTEGWYKGIRVDHPLWKRDTEGRPATTEHKEEIAIEHMNNIRNALKAGKPVPKEVLTEYPDLTPAKPPLPKLPEVKPPEAVREPIEAEGIVEPTPKTWESEFNETYKKSEFSEPERWDEFKAFSKKEYAEDFPVSEHFEMWMKKPYPKVEKVPPEKKEYFITTPEGKQKIEGKPIKIKDFEKYDLFYSKSDGEFNISEMTTGLSLATDKTLKGVKQKVFDLLTERKGEIDKVLKEKPKVEDIEEIPTIKETKDSLLKNIKDEKGESEIINDLARLGADAIRRGHESFKAFSVQIKTTLSEVWDKIKHLMQKAYAAAKVVIKSERGEIVLRERKEPTPEYTEMLKRYKKVEVTKAKTKTDRLGKISLDQKTKQGITATQEITDSPSSPEGFNMSSEGKGRQILDTIQWKMQDRLIHLKKVQVAIEAEKSIELPDSSNVYQTEELYHYKTTKRIKDADRDLFDPLTESIAKSVHDLEDVELFLRARHAPEANKRLQEINPKRPDNTALSGMSNAEADKIMGQYGKDAVMLDIASQIDTITKATRQTMINDGLATKNEIKAWEDAYKYYIPLKREGKGSEMPKKGRGMYVGGKESKMRLTGSEDLKPVNIVANIMAQHESTIIRAEKTKVGRAMLKLAKEYPNKDLWIADAPELKPFLKQRKDDAKQLDLFTGLPGALSEVVYGRDILYKFADNVLVTKIDGIEHTVTFNDQNVHSQRIVRSLKNLGADNSNAVLNVLSKVNRVLAMVNTSLNPEFIFSNFTRDMQTAGYNIHDTEAKGVKAKIFRDVFKAMRGIRHGVRGKYDIDWAKNYEAFEKSGAQTGWIDYYKNIEAREKTLKKNLGMLKEGAWPATQRTIKGVFDFISNENTAVENAIRLSAFAHLTGRTGVPRILSDAKGASTAKNMTVNFNRRGDAGQAMNALYLFFNANAQGSVRLIYAASKSPTVRRLMYGTVGFAVMLDMLNRSIGGEDDDGENKYDKVPVWVKEHNMVIMRPNGDYFKIPLPWGYNTLHVLGQIIGESVDPNYQKDFSAIASAGRLGGAVLASFNPLGSESSLLQIVSPTIVDPFIQWSENQNFAGIPLRPEQNPFDVPKPEYQMYFRNAREPSKWMAKQLNDLTGGDITKPGLVDVSPEVFDLFIDTFTGGVGKFLDNTLRIPKTLTEKDVDVRHIPFVRRMYGEPSEFAARTTFYDNLNDIRYAEKSVKHYRNIRDFDGLKKTRKANAIELRFVERAKNTKKEVDKLRKQQKQIEKSKLTKEAKEKRIEEKEKRIRQKINRFNKQYFDAKQGRSN